MAKRDRLSGNEAVAYAMKQIDPDVMGAFPITPSTEIPQYFAQYVANGQVNTEYVTVESEHSSMSTCIGAEAAGARAVTATSSCGLALMWELLYVAASYRLPVTLACVNRALTGPININNDHSDSMGARDTGWIQIYAENNQEAYDNYLQAMPIGENPEVRLPVMVCQDGFITSHAVENIELCDDADVKNFVGTYEPENYLLKHENPLAVGPYGISPYYMEAKVAQADAMKKAKQVILDVGRRFGEMTGRSYGSLKPTAWRTPKPLCCSSARRRVPPAPASMNCARRAKRSACSSCVCSAPSRMRNWPRPLATSRPWPFWTRPNRSPMPAARSAPRCAARCTIWMSVPRPSTMSMVWAAAISACRIAPRSLPNWMKSSAPARPARVTVIWASANNQGGFHHAI